MAGAQIALMNPGGVRADLTYAEISGGEQPGEVTYGEAFDVQPFGNLLVTMDLTGAQIERLLEQQAIDGRPGGRDVLIFGVSERVRVHATTRPGPSATGSTRRASRSTARALDPAATYRIVTNNFLADGGDSFTVFTEGTNRARRTATTWIAFVDYLGANSPVESARGPDQSASEGPRQP